MAKSCNCGCGLPVFSHGYSMRCQYKRTDEKWIRKLEADKEKAKSRGIKTSPKKEPTGEKDMFDEIWNERERVSYVSGTRLQKFESSPLYVNLFAHVLSKAKNRYPLFRLKKENVVLLTPAEHSMYDHGTEDLRRKYAEEMLTNGIVVDWDKLYNLAETLKNEYNSMT